MSEYRDYSEETLSVTSEPFEAGQRVDTYLAQKIGLTRSAVSRLLESGDVLCAGAAVAKNYKVRAGDSFEISLPRAQCSEALPEDIPLDVVYEDGDIIVINKPKGMVVHPAAGNPDGTLVNALLFHCKDSLSGVGGVVRPGIVHRIDKDTGGLLVVAKNDASHLFLSEQIKQHKVQRIYYAIILGNLKEDTGTVDAPIGRHPADRKKMAVLRSPEYRSRAAVTHWRVIERFGRFTLVRCELETGRTHQIRVHMSSIGHPLLGDGVYGGDGTQFEARHRALISGQCLFAAELHLAHPATGEQMVFKAPLPEYFEKLLSELRGQI